MTPLIVRLLILVAIFASVFLVSQIVIAWSYLPRPVYAAHMPLATLGVTFFSPLCLRFRVSNCETARA